MAHPPLGAPFAAVLRLLVPRDLPASVARLRTEAEEERGRWFLWLPLPAAIGVALYFSLSFEPDPRIGWATLGLALALTLARRLIAVPRVLLIGGVAFAAGFVAAQARTMTVTAPALARAGVYDVEGIVELAEPVERGVRVVVEGPLIGGLAPEATPTRIRFSVRNDAHEVRPGDTIRVRARLMPPSPPPAPGDFDFARHAFFEGLGAVGYAFGRADVERTPGGPERLLASLRQRIASAITDAVPGAAGAVASALLTGLRAGIPDQVWGHMQASGLAHLLAISGLHLGLVAGTLFFAARIMIALVPPLALRINGKKVAALVALLGAFAYLMITGQTVPTQRAFIMTALMLLAVMVDRNPFSMRLIAFAALVVLAFRPEALLGPSFQMSFAAVVGLIAVYESGIGPKSARLDGLDRRLLVYVLGVLLTTAVASLVTAPFVAHHFGRLPTYGVLANLVAVPLTAFWIMPLGLLGLLLMPLGLDGFAFAWMGSGIEVVLALAAWVADLPGAAVRLPPPPLAALVVVTLGGLWTCFWRRPWRRFGLAALPLALVLWLVERPPDLLIDARGELIAIRLDDGGVALAPYARDGWVHGMWLERYGAESAAPWPGEGEASADGSLACDPLGCVLVRHGQRIAIARRPEALLEDCSLAELTLSWPRVERCPGAGWLIGPQALRDAGGLALRIEPQAIEVETVRERRGARPWTGSAD